MVKILKHGSQTIKSQIKTPKILLAFILFLNGIPLENLAQKTALQKDFEEIIVHPFADCNDSLSDQQIIEYRSTNGLSIHFKRNIKKPVCLSKTCRPLNLTIIWDGVGNFKGIELLENEPLTKTDHSEFTADDYRKLNRILSNKASILGTLEKEDLILEDKRELLEDGIDAYSGATKPSLYDQVVRDAVYTCYTLWHTVYGPTQDRIQEILDEKANCHYINLALTQKENASIIWGIDYLMRHPSQYKEFYTLVTPHINSDNNELSQKAMAYFTPERLTNTKVQEKLAESCNLENQLDIIWMLTSIEKLNAEVIILLLDGYKNGNIDEAGLMYIYKMITKKHLNNASLNRTFQELLNHKNRYTRNITSQLLKKYEKM